jgi:hypothetical protein
MNDRKDEQPNLLALNDRWLRQLNAMIAAGAHAPCG